MDEQPICADCEKRGPPYRPGKELHHIEPIAAAPHKRLDRSNVEMLCEECHDARHGGKSQRGSDRDNG